MTTFSRHTRHLLALVIAITALLAAAAPMARAAGGATATWAAWALTIDFPDGQPRVIYTTYIGTNTPTPTVLDSIETDISADCIPYGSLAYEYDENNKKYYASFDGQSHLECQIPEWRAQVAELAPHLPTASQVACECRPGRVPFFVAADVRLDPQQSANPMFESQDLGVTFSLPSDGVVARTRMALSSRTYVSPDWAVDSAGNRMVMGQHGPGTVAVSSYFGWLDFLTGPDWDNFFNGFVKGTYVGHWVESPGTFLRMSGTSLNYTLGTQSAVAYIGYSPTTGAHLRGDLGELVVDPGCQGT